MIPGLGRSLEKENGNPLQYSCLENSMNGGEAWRATVHRVTKSWTQLRKFTFTSMRHWLVGKSLQFWGRI